MSNDLISRQAAIDALKEVSEHYTDKGREWHPHINFMVQAIEELPTVEDPIRRGRWLDWMDGFKKCSECGAVLLAENMFANYCPRCGAKMDGERKDDE